MARKNFVHFRVDDELADALDRYAEKNRVSRSTAARALLETSLGIDEGLDPEDAATAAIVSQAFHQFHGAVSRAVGKVASELTDRLPKILQREIQQ